MFWFVEILLLKGQSSLKINDITKKNIWEFLMVKFPIFFPLSYIFLLNQYPNYESYIIFITLLILAEPHFGATWPFLLYKKNYAVIKERNFFYIFIPIFICLFSIFLFYYSKTSFYFIFLVANIYHVTKQSVGISKLYIKNVEEKSFQSITIYCFAILFFFIGILRFYGPLQNTTLISIISLSLIIITLIVYVSVYKVNENILILLTGILIFFPMCFVSKPIHGIIMGVTMHYTQYLYLTYKVYKGRRRENEQSLSIKKNYYLIIIVFYGVIMSLLATSGKSLNIENLILIPIIGQFLHFYIDSLLWKFSNEHHRNVTLKFLK